MLISLFVSYHELLKQYYVNLTFYFHTYIEDSTATAMRHGVKTLMYISQFNIKVILFEETVVGTQGPYLTCQSLFDIINATVTLSSFNCNEIFIIYYGNLT